jgi:pyruvate dehydrogenase E1 component alpha subunit
MTYRWHGHNEGEETFAGNYRPQDEQDAWRAREPISAYVKTLDRHRRPHPGGRRPVDAEEISGIDDAWAFAEQSPFPDAEEALEDVFATITPRRVREEQP